MKKIVFILTLLVLILPVAVSAKEGDSSTTKPFIKEKIEKRAENKQAEILQKTGERKAEFAKKHSERITKRFAEYYERLTKIIAKVQIRLTNMSTDGKDVSKALAKLDEAKSKLESAKALSVEAVSLFSSISTGNLGSNSEIVKNAKVKADEARKAFVLTHKLIRESVRLARGIEK